MPFCTNEIFNTQQAIQLKSLQIERAEQLHNTILAPNPSCYWQLHCKVELDTIVTMNHNALEAVTLATTYLKLRSKSPDAAELLRTIHKLRE